MSFCSPQASEKRDTFHTSGTYVSAQTTVFQVLGHCMWLMATESDSPDQDILIAPENPRVRPIPS